jgi:1-deoxy-D-xylulose-5-phosphate reductoisomerase
MGTKISVDSSTLMNKALEVIEAKWLFNLEAERIEVVVHPQSIIHSMVRLTDGGLLAQLSVPDMKGPIAYALTFPEKRLRDVIPRLNFNQLSGLSFEPVDHQRFPSVRMAIECLNGSKGAAAVFNTANEVAVARFLSHEVGFLDIFKIVEQALERFGSSDYINLEDLNDLCLEVAEWSRQMTRSA